MFLPTHWGYKVRKILLILFTLTTIHFSQEDVHQFKMLTQVKTTPVKSQGRSGTCWAFATTSFVETELIRMGLDEC